jgi:hypothetical protein
VEVDELTGILVAVIVVLTAILAFLLGMIFGVALVNRANKEEGK